MNGRGHTKNWHLDWLDWTGVLRGSVWSTEKSMQEDLDSFFFWFLCLGGEFYGQEGMSEYPMRGEIATASSPNLRGFAVALPRHHANSLVFLLRIEESPFWAASQNAG